MAEESSRLLTGEIYYQGQYISIKKYRDMIFARSLYSLDNEYENTNLFSLNNKGNVASSISTVLNVIPQYNRMQVNTNLLGNVYDAFRDEGSALAKIGLVMLGKQMAYNSASNLATQHLPTIDFSQALKGNIKGIFKKNIDNSITVKDADDRTGLEKVGDFANKYLGFRTYDIFGNANPFPQKGVTNIEYIRNTGEAQLTHFYKAINLNLYKPINYDADSNIAKTFVDYSNKVGVTIDSTRISILINQPSFTFGNAKYHQYSSIGFNDNAVVKANTAMNIAYSGNTNRIQEYAPTNDYIINNFGTTKKKKKYGLEDYVEGEAINIIDAKENNLVWGRDGVTAGAETKIKKLRGDDDIVLNNLEEFGFNIKEGLLEYTKNLLNASEGQFVDITRKVFQRDKNVIGFNGSALWKSNNSKYANDSKLANKTGIRQHTILDQYDRFAKTIRFKGNVVYNGNTNSVINKTVLPRIHPTMDAGKLNPKNLMLSLENLAIGTIARDTYGVIDDEYGTAIPLSEVGPFNGRIMWFPPYDLQVQEVAIAKYESTVMVGRNEPMYNYMNSERTAVLNFTLLIDYPEQLRNSNLVGNDKNKAIVDFFAFGGDPLPEKYNNEVWEKRIKYLLELIVKIEGHDDQAEPSSIAVNDTTIHFQNNTPTEEQVDTIIDIMYNDPNHYEIIDGCLSAQDKNGFGLNNKIYFVEGLSGNTIIIDRNNLYALTGTSNQYTVTGITGQFGSVCELNENLLKIYGDETNRKYYIIKIEAESSKLYLSNDAKAYNEALGDRRVRAAEKLIRSRLKIMFPELADNDINIETKKSTGSAGNSELGADANNMHLKEIKQERTATISIVRNTKDVERKVNSLNQNDKDNIIKIRLEINSLELKIKKVKNFIVSDNMFTNRSDAILKGFEASSKNEYYPAFHSQTPEDFHRRLTFLQQCMRQGAAKRYDMVDEDGILRAKNSVFGKQPICILRVGDFFYTKVIIENVTIDYNDTTWDMNPEGFGMQPMIAKITLTMKLIGGQSLSGPIDALQNAVSFNYYANSNFTDTGMYSNPAKAARDQENYINKILTTKKNNLKETNNAT